MSHSNNGPALDALRQLSDEELAHAAAKGDDNAASVLLERFEEPLYRYTIALIPDQDREARIGGVGIGLDNDLLCRRRVLH